ncbi:MAG: hypothetical protein P8Z79_04110 [Sedimentisphaerales bacterium]
MCSKSIRLTALAIVLAVSAGLQATTIIWVSDNRVAGREQGWIDLLEANGYTVDLSFNNQEGRVLDAAKLEALNAADLIIVGRDMLSAEYSGGTEPTQWNSLTTPLIMLNGWLPGSERWKWLGISTNVERAITNLDAVMPGHPVFAGVALDADDQVSILTTTCQFTDTSDPGNGTLIARNVSNDDVWIVEWKAGQEFYPGSGQTAGGSRMLLVGGSQPNPGEYNFTDDGEKIFLNAVRYMLNIKQEKAFNPIPPSGTLYEDTWVTLNWSPGESAVSHDVYLGVSFDDVNEATPDSDVFQGNQTTTFLVAGFPGFAFPEGLVPGTTYYWRIDEINDADPNSPWKGDVWNFTIPTDKAHNPNPADGAESVDLNVKLSWETGFGAKTHTVFFGDDFDTVSNATVGNPVGTTTYNPGPLKLAKSYYWRVDEFDGINTHRGDIWSFTTVGGISDPSPTDGAVDITQTPTLTWTPGAPAASHEIYFGSDEDAVRNATKASPEYKGTRVLGDESYAPGELAWEATYYWRVDEVNDVNPDSPWKGPVWSFTTADFAIVDDFEGYTDDDADGQAIWQSWIDGFGIADNGSQVGYLLPPYAEQTIVHGGLQSMPLTYNNTDGVGNSEATLTLTAPRDWTVENVAELSLWFHGLPGSVGSFTEDPAGTFTMTGSGADIWGTADQCHFAYKMLTGAGSIIAKVDSVQNTNGWAKAGVMIRETLDAGSKHAFAAVTPANGVAFQGRGTADGDSFSTNQTGLSAPYWVKLERTASNTFTVSHSANGTTWSPVTDATPRSISMASTVYIGLALTSHDAALTCEAVFSNVATTGSVSGQWSDQDIGITSNTAEPLYVAISNASGAPAVVVNEDPAAATIDAWTQWRIPLQAFADQGINLQNVDKIAIGLGATGDPSATGGTGTIYIDDIRLYP